MTTDNIAKGIAAAVLAAGLYALVPNIARLAFESGIPALETVTCRTLATILLLGAWALATGQSLRIPTEVRGSFLLQCIATFIVSTSYLASLQFIPVGLSVIIFFCAPVIILVLSPVLEGQHLHWQKVLLALIAFAGLVIAIGPRFNHLDPRGLGLAGLAASGYAMQFFSGRITGQKMPTQAMGGLVHLAILGPILFMAFWSGEGGIKLLGAGAYIWSLMLLAGFFYCAAYVMQMSAVKAAPSSVVAPWFNLEPVVTTGLALLLLGEKLASSHVVGGAIVLGVLFVSEWLDRSGSEKSMERQ